MDNMPPTRAELDEARRDVKRQHDLALREVEAIERIAEFATWWRQTFGPLFEALAEEFSEDLKRRANRARV